MAEQDYKPNSHKYREEQKATEKRVEKVVRGTVKTKKKNELRKFTDIFISEDIRTVRSYIFMDVLVPAIKKAVEDIIVDGVHMMLHGESGRSRKRSSGEYVSYRNYSDRRGEPARVKTRFDYDDLIFESRGEVEAIRDQMEDIIDRYGFVTVADLYDMADLSAPYTSNKYGWTSVRNAEPVRVAEGYILKLPRAMAID